MRVTWAAAGAGLAAVVEATKDLSTNGKWSHPVTLLQEMVPTRP